MARGPKKHMKRLNAPKHWMLDKMGGVWAPRPSPGPHKLRECLPLILILRNKLKYALNKQEVQSICMSRLVKVDGKVRTDSNFPAGFMDVVQIPKSSDQFRLLYDTKGRFVLNRIDDAEAKYKLCRVTRAEKTKRGIPYVVTHDGRTIRYPDPLIKVNDTVKLNIETGKIVDFAKFEMGQVVMITKGRNTGRVGVMEHRERHPGSFDIIQLRDAADNTFATRMTNVFVLGKGEDAWVSLPRGAGIKKTIHQQKSEKDANKA